ncbi:MAG: Flp family type IVb pilin [Holosporaceae bacterium]|jgi:pilus assembly protein Flp/PilA|nr:Flp family type IVb pilin [Holosporaceae bacterium]
MLMSLLRKIRKSSRGATLIEYGLLAALIAVMCILGIRSVGNSANIAFSKAAGALDGAV